MSEKRAKMIKLPKFNHEDLSRELSSIAKVYEIPPYELMNFVVADWLFSFHIANDTYNPDRKDCKGSAMLSFLASVEKHSAQFKEYLSKCNEKKKD